MRVYTKIVMRIDTGRIVSARGYDYAGSVALCKGGGGSTIDSVDEAYNAGMLELSEQEWAVAQEYVNLFKYGVDYDPEATEQGLTIDGKWVPADQLTPEQTGGDKWIDNPDYVAPGWELMSDAERGDYWQETKGSPAGTPQKILNPNFQLETRTLGEIKGYDPDAQVSEMELILQGQAAQSELLPLQTALARSQIEADQTLIPAQTEVSMAQLAAEKGLVPQRAALESASLADTQTALAERAPVRSAFYNAALNGPDATERADQAQAGIEHAFSTTAKDFERDLFTSGAHVQSSDLTKAMNERSIAKAGGIAGARTQAKLLAEEELFNKLKTAMTV